MFGTTPGDRATMARGLAALFGAGATLVLITLALPHDASTDDLLVAIPPALAYVVAGLLLAFAGRFSPALLALVTALGTVLITACIAWGGASAAAYPLMYVWVALYAGYFFGVRTIVAELALSAALFAAVLRWRDDIPVPQAHLVMAVGTAVVSAALIAALVRRMRAQRDDLAAVADLANGITDLAVQGVAICRQVLRSTGADLAALVEPAPDGEGLRVVVREGGEGLAQLQAGLRGGIELSLRGAAPIVLQAGAGGRHRVAGLAQPVLRDGRAVAVLVLAWRRPRRGLSDRAREAAAVFAGQAGVAMERLERLTRERERRALEINDRIVQGLVVAKYALESGETVEARRSVDDTLARARDLVTEQLDELVETGGEIGPGDLVLEAPGGRRGADGGPTPPAPPAG